MTDPAHQREALRQQVLLRALWRDAPTAVVQGWLRGAPARTERGLQAYQANAGALAERALLAAYPVLAQLVGGESFAGLARTLWRLHAPVRGDMALWGAELPAFIEAAESLADEPYLADVARLEWAMHQVQSAADAVPVTGLQLLAEEDPAKLTIHLTPGASLCRSAHPIVTIWQAHQGVDSGTDEQTDDHTDDHTDDRFAPVRAAFASGAQESAFVWRAGLVPRVQTLTPGQATFVAALLNNVSLEQALKEAGELFDFEAWLVAALQLGWLMAVATRG